MSLSPSTGTSVESVSPKLDFFNAPKLPAKKRRSTHRLGRKFRALSFALAVAALSATAHAATEYWDTGAGGTTIATQGSGTWNTTTTNWESTSPTKIGWTNGNVAAFSTAGATVSSTVNTNAGTADATIDSINVSLGQSGLIASQLFFNNTGFVITAATAQTLTLSTLGTDIVVANGKTASVGSNATINFASLAGTNTSTIVAVGGIGGGAFNVESGGTLSYSSGVAGGNGQLSFRTNADAAGESGTINVTGTINFAATTPISQISLGQTNGAVTMNVNSGGLVTSASTGAANNLGSFLLSNNGATAILNINTGGTVTLSGTASTAGLDVARGAGSTGAGSGTVNLNGGTLTTARSFSGTSVASNTTATSTFNFNGGTLTADVNNNVDFMKGLTRANVRDGGAVIDTNGFNVTIGQALVHSNVTGNNPNTGAPDSATDGGLTKKSAGTLTLTGVNTYTGATAINGGALAVTGSLGGSSTVTVGGAAASGTPTLTGTGTVNGPVIVAAAGGGAAGTINPGAVGTVGTLTLGSTLALNAGSLNFDLGSTSGSSDLLAVTGAVTTNGTTLLNLSAPTLTNGTYTLITAASGLGTSSFAIGTRPAGRITFDLSSSTSTAEKVIISVNPFVTGNEYWTGAASQTAADTANNFWSTGTTTSNFSTDLAGSVDPNQVPGVNTDVVFTATNATPNSGSTLTTKLDANYAVRSVVFDVPSATGITSTVIDTNANTLTLTGTGSTTGNGLTLASTSTSAGTIGGTGSVVLNGSQSWANNNATLGLTVSTGISGLSGATILTLNGTGAGGVTLGGVISNGNATSLGLVFNQAGVTQLNNNNTFTGGVVINGGTVQLGNAGAFNSTAPNALSFGSGSTGDLQLNGKTVTVSGLSTDPTTVGTPIVENANAAPATLTSAVAGTNVYGGVLQDGVGGGALSFTKSGAGTLTLNGAAANTNTGLTSVTAGTLILAKATGNNAVAGNITATGGTTFLQLNANDQIADAATLTLDTGAHFVLNGFTETVGGLVSGSAGTNSLLEGSENTAPLGTLASVLTVNNSVDNLFDGIIRNTSNSTGTFGLTKNGAGTLTLTNTGGVVGMTFTGATTIGGGTLALRDNGNGKTIGTWASAITDNATLSLADTLAANTQTLSQVISGAGGNVIVASNNVGTVALTKANTYGGSTTISAGTLQLGNGTTGNDGSITNTSGVTNNGTLAYNLFGTQNAGYVIGGSGSLVKSGAGTLTLTGTNTYSGVTNFNGGILQINVSNNLGDASATNTLGFNGGTLELLAGNTLDLGANRAVALNGAGTFRADAGSALTISGAVTGVGSLTANGPGTVTLSGTDTYSGATASNGGGTLALSGTLTTTGNVTAALGAASTGTLAVLSGGNLTAANVYIGNGTTPSLTAAGVGTVASGGTISTSGGLYVGFAGSGSTGLFTINGGTVNVRTNAANTGNNLEVGTYDSASGTLTINSGSLNLENNALFVLGAQNTSANGTVNQEGGAVTFYSNSGTTVGGTGQLILGSAGSPTGTYTYNLDGGTLTVPSVTKVNGTAGVLNFNGGVISPTATTTTFIQNLTRANVRNGGAVINTNGFNVTVPQALLHSNVANDNATDGGLTLSGTGTLSLSGVNTYTGVTSVTGGTLLIASTGSINGSAAVSVANGGALTLNNAAALSDTGTLTLVGGAAFNLNDPNTGGTSTETIGALVLDGTSEPAGTYTAAQLSGFDPTIAFSSLNGETLTIAVPEPSTVIGGLLLVGATGWTLRRRVRGGAAAV